MTKHIHIHVGRKKGRDTGDAQHGIYYGTRKIQDPRGVGTVWAILVRAYDNGKFVEEDRNNTPYLQQERALSAARNSAEEMSINLRLPIIGKL